MKKVKDAIHNLRKQPDEVKRHILHAATLVFGIILVSLWVYSLGVRAEDKDEARDEATLKPLSVLKDNLVGGIESMSESE